MLILHFDVNETILIGDPAGGDTFDDTLHKALAKVALLDAAAAERGELRLYAADPLGAAWTVPDDAELFYRSPLATSQLKRRFGTHFPEYGQEIERMRAALRAPATVDKRLTRDGEHFFIVPAFWRALEWLLERGEPFRVVIRTFGSDCEDVIDALLAWRSQLDESMQENVELPTDANDFYRGRYEAADSKHDEFVFTLCHNSQYKENEDSTVNNGVLRKERRVLDLLEAVDSPKQAVFTVVQDDYEHWRDGDYNPAHGKPLWLHDNHQHIFFDDNIHREPDDSIVAARVLRTEDDEFVPLNGQETINLHGKHLFKVFTRHVVLDDQYFIELIKRCEFYEFF